MQQAKTSYHDCKAFELFKSVCKHGPLGQGKINEENSFWVYSNDQCISHFPQQALISALTRYLKGRNM
jgi:hypothetical protein